MVELLNTSFDNKKNTFNKRKGDNNVRQVLELMNQHFKKLMEKGNKKLMNGFYIHIMKLFLRKYSN